MASKELYEDIYKEAFSFGKNWSAFLKKFNKNRLALAKQSLVNFLEKDNLNDELFLDIGCGSGLFSLAALELGARRVISIDPDDSCISCTKYLRKKFNYSEEKWTIKQGSALDIAFLQRLTKADIVYSWGVLHHTGDMWRAINNAIELILPKGYLYIALYNYHKRFISSNDWLKIKRIYLKSPTFIKVLMQWAYSGQILLSRSLHFEDPISYVRNYNKRSERGMSFYNDVIDWLGGYPYEYSTPEETIKFCSRRDLDLVKFKHRDGTGCNEFLFRRNL